MAYNPSFPFLVFNESWTVYYVFFTTATILASVTLFKGFNDTTTVQTVSVFCGFFTIFVGVFLLNSSKAAQGGAVGNNSLDKSGNQRHGISENGIRRDGRDGLVAETHLLTTFDEESIVIEDDSDG